MRKSKINELICKKFFGLGVPASLMGFKYLREAIEMVLEDESVLHKGITKHMYPTIARNNHTTPSRVERAMRHAVEVSFLRCDYETLERNFGNCIKSKDGKLANSEFIACVAEVLRIEIQRAGEDNENV